MIQARDIVAKNINIIRFCFFKENKEWGNVLSRLDFFPSGWFSDGLPHAFQAFLDAVYDLNGSLWDSGSRTEDGAHAAPIQELVVLRWWGEAG